MEKTLKSQRHSKTKAYIIAIAIPLLVGGLSSLLTMGNMDIYNEITKPPLAPPGILFPIVWTVLYILMGISSGLIATDDFAKRTEKESALTPYAASLFVNFFWSILFFNLRAFFPSFIWLLLLEFLIIMTIKAYLKINKTAAYLQIPYALWVAFAGYLNLSIWLLNR